MGKRKKIPQYTIIECRDTQTGGEEPDILKLLTHKDLVIMTDNFREDNFIGSYQFGKLYRGFINDQHFTIKTWDTPEIDATTLGNHERRLMDELIMLRHERLVHPCIASLYGYCRDKDHLAVVYNLKTLDSLFNLLPREDFTWIQRIEAAFELASLLKFLQKRLGDLDPFVIRNLAAEHVILDEKYNPKLVDFSMITGGIFSNRHQYSIQPSYGCIAYRDPDLFQDLPAHIATWTKKSDVFAFGVMLLSLISKKITTDEMYCMGEISVCDWAHNKYELCESLVHESLHAHPCFYDVDGKELSMIGVLCTSDNRQDQPSMKEVVHRLLQLCVLENLKELLIKKLDPYFSIDSGKNKKPFSDMKYRDTQIGDFKWLHMTKAACGVASLLKFLHVVPHRMDPFIIRNLRSIHIMLDEEYNPKLIDFDMIVGGIFPSLGRQEYSL